MSEGTERDCKCKYNDHINQAWVLSGKYLKSRRCNWREDRRTCFWVLTRLHVWNGMLHRWWKWGSKRSTWISLIDWLILVESSLIDLRKLYKKYEWHILQTYQYCIFKFVHGLYLKTYCKRLTFIEVKHSSPKRSSGIFCRKQIHLAFNFNYVILLIFVKHLNDLSWIATHW